MKTRDTIIFGLLVIIVIVALVLAVTSKDDEDTQPSETAEVTEPTPVATEGDLSLVPAESSIAWRGSKKILKEWVDTGVIEASSAVLNIDEEGAITGGSIVIDMTSIEATATGRGDGNEQLTGHLSSPDFFDVEAYPEASFVITEVSEEGGETVLTGELTIKETTRSVDIPVVVVETDGVYEVDGSVDIDRTEFDVRFGSDKFFDNLGDNVIEDIFTVTFDLEFEA